MKSSLLATLNEERTARRACVVVTDLASGQQRLVKASETVRDPLAIPLETRLRSGKSGIEEIAGGKLFLTVHVPPPNLVITGAVHISQALAPMAMQLGYDVTVIDPRTAFATKERFEGINLLADWPDRVLPS
nr:XdhC family protein [Xanthobacteraceae bacterium]